MPDVKVWLKKVEFEVSPKANEQNKGAAFACHIVVPYAQDLYDILRSMDSVGYFSKADSLEKTYGDSIQVFKYDLKPGINKEKVFINVRSYTKAKGAFIFAKLTPGNYMRNIGGSENVVIRFLPNSMEVIAAKSITDMLEEDKSKFVEMKNQFDTYKGEIQDINNLFGNKKNG